MDRATDPSLLAVMQLADGRFPTGGHAHSLGFEAAAARFDLEPAPSMAEFVTGRLHTSGRTDAHLIAAIRDRMAGGVPDWRAIDQEIDARIVSPRLRRTSRSLGRQWLRAGRRIWPDSPLPPAAGLGRDPHQVAAFAAVSVQAGVGAADAIAIHLHQLVAAIITAAVRLFGIDPYAAQRVQADFGGQIVALVDAAMATAGVPFSDLPASSGPLTDLLAEEHGRWDSRLFPS